MEIIVKSKKYGNKICIIDDSDFEAVKSMSLSVKPSDGGVFYIRAGNVGLHRILLNAPKGVCFRTAKEAAMAYNDAAIKQFGSGVFLNDISLL